MALFLTAFATLVFLSQASDAQLETECVNSADCSSVSLLQTGLQVRNLQREALQSEAVIGNSTDSEDDWLGNHPDFDPAFHLYGLSPNATKRPDGMFELSVRADGKCYLKVPVAVRDYTANLLKGVDAGSLRVPEIWADEPDYNGFLLGECPRLLSIQSKKRLTKDFPYLNPGLLAMPSKLKSFFPSGHWMTLGLGGGIQVFDDNFAPLMSNFTRVRAVGVPHEQYYSKSASKKLFIDETLVGDPRLFPMNDGTIAVSFISYELQDTQHALPSPRSWWGEPLFGVLHVDGQSSGNGSIVDAWVDRQELRTLARCPGVPQNNVWSPTFQKNMNFMQRPGGDLYLINWVYPPSIGKFDLKSPPMQINNSLFGTTCFGFSHPSTLSDESIFGIKPPKNLLEKNLLPGIKHNEPYGNGSPVWIHEIQEFLGVAHIHRGWGDSASNAALGKRAAWYGHHYTHFFFTYSKEAPFKMTSMSPEWCIPSDHDPQDCEIIQFVNGLQRDGQQLVMTYGVMDETSYATKVNMSTVLSSLRPVA